MKIIKYKNRKLYSVEKANYVTLTEIRAAIVSGAEFSATEHTTGTDISAHILSQVLANVVTIEKAVSTSALIELIKSSYTQEK